MNIAVGDVELPDVIVRPSESVLLRISLIFFIGRSITLTSSMVLISRCLSPSSLITLIWISSEGSISSEKQLMIIQNSIR